MMTAEKLETLAVAAMKERDAEAAEAWTHFSSFDISGAERQRIADKARDIGESHSIRDEREMVAGRAFLRIWESETWWSDVNN